MRLDADRITTKSVEPHVIHSVLEISTIKTWDTVQELNDQYEASSKRERFSALSEQPVSEQASA